MFNQKQITFRLSFDTVIVRRYDIHRIWQDVVFRGVRFCLLQDYEVKICRHE